MSGKNDTFKISLHTLTQAKRLFLVRHGEAVHNAENNVHGDKVYFDPKLTDCKLTQKGIVQAKALQGRFKATELVIMSPLERAIETTLHIFNATENSNNLPPSLVLDQLREITGKHYPDKRLSISIKKLKYPNLNFAQIKEDEDKLWVSEKREEALQVQQRIMEFIKFLFTRNEHTITVVTHHGVLDCFFKLLTGEGQHFENCEVKEIILVNHHAKL